MSTDLAGASPHQISTLVCAGIVGFFTCVCPASDLSLSRWQQVGMGGGGFYVTIAFSPQLNQNGFYTVYIGGDTLGLFKSEDNGASWTAANEGLYNWRVSDIAINPTDPRIMFLATDGGLYRSNNGGDTWTPISYGRTFSTRVRNNALCSVTVDPTDGNTVFVGTGFKDSAVALSDPSGIRVSEIYRSSNGGETGSWQRVYNSLYGTNSLIYDITVNPRRPHSVYAALGPSRGSATGGMLLHSTDHGTTWSVVENAHGFYKLEFGAGKDLHVTGWNQSVQSDLCWYYASAATSGGMYVGKLVDDHDDIVKSDLVSITPAPISGRPGSACGLAVASDGTVYVGDMRRANPAVWKRTQGQWTSMNVYDRVNPGWNDFSEYGNPRNVASLLGLSPDGAVWHGGSMALFRWTDNEWRERYSYPVAGHGYANRGNENTFAFSANMIFYSATEYYWGLGDVYIVGTQDGGKSAFQVKWPEANLTSGPGFNDARVFTADRRNNNVWYVVTHLQDRKYYHGALLRKKNLPLETDPQKLWETLLTSCSGRAADGNRSCPFSPVDLPDAGGMTAVLADGDTILVATYYGGVYCSTNGGAAGSWHRVTDLGNYAVYGFAQSALDPGVILAAVGRASGSASGNGVWRSLDRGATWTRVWAVSASNSSYAVEYAGATAWYANKDESVYRTTDNGATWTLVYTWTKRPDPVFPNNNSPVVNKISVGIRNVNNPNENPVCAAFTIDGWFDHPSTGGAACSIEGAGTLNTWEQVPLYGISHQAKGVKFNPYDLNELFYLSGGSGVYRTRLTSATPTLMSPRGLHVVQ